MRLIKKPRDDIQLDKCYNLSKNIPIEMIYATKEQTSSPHSLSLGQAPPQSRRSYRHRVHSRHLPSPPTERLRLWRGRCVRYAFSRRGWMHQRPENDNIKGHPALWLADQIFMAITAQLLFICKYGLKKSLWGRSRPFQGLEQRWTFWHGLPNNHDNIFEIVVEFPYLNYRKRGFNCVIPNSPSSAIFLRVDCQSRLDRRDIFLM